MWYEGKVKSYNESRGFGFISCEHDKKDLFFHIRDVPNRHKLPQVGERLKFLRVEHDGRLRAENIVRLDLKTHEPSSQYTIQKTHDQTIRHPLKSRKKPQTQASSSVLNLFISAAAIGVFAVIVIPMIVSLYQRETLKYQPAQATQTTSLQKNTTIYRCDGRTHCSEMRSYEEAKFFIHNCPGTKMDGDGDGEPCERQF
ncbi:cold shock domain-containing protein [uncultured Acinetobacter sp.]|uniref:cold shock domain-containing protein n=1 Tax=uncultured Acinetobacter sp. TaxID=165433 RepID=UPI002607BC7E|nr:cold shock domain-containing protein [uncultured Acinetobacter sp.]